MAWRIDEQVVRGEIDNRTPGRVTGKLWLAGREEAVELALEGNPWRDLAGHVLKFSNPDAKPGAGAGISALQEGRAGDITASRKVKVPECTMEELMEFYSAKQPFPWHRGNSLYLEWYSVANGRVVIESANYTLELDAEPAWVLTEEEEISQRAASEEAMMNLLGKFSRATGISGDDDLPRSPEDARMEVLLDRVNARLHPRKSKPGDFQRIFKEEQERMMRELVESAPEPPTDDGDEWAPWIEELDDTLDDGVAERWKDGDGTRENFHALPGECADFAVSLHREIVAGGWLPADAHQEHPLHEILRGVENAGAKLADGCGLTGVAWPPSASIAAGVLTGLKQARGHLRDVLLGLDAAEEECLLTPGWRQRVREKALGMLEQIQGLIRDVRDVLDFDGDDEFGLL